MTVYHRTLCIVAAALLSSSGYAGPTIHHAQNKLLDIQVLAHGYDKGGEFCADFILTSTQVEWFFSRAKILDARLLHDQFDIIPCWVRGTAQSNQGTWQWEIRAGGTARKVFKNGAIELLGCDKCDAVLMGDKAYPK